MPTRKHLNILCEIEISSKSSIHTFDFSRRCITVAQSPILSTVILLNGVFGYLSYSSGQSSQSFHCYSSHVPVFLLARSTLVKEKNLRLAAEIITLVKARVRVAKEGCPSCIQSQTRDPRTDTCTSSHQRRRVSLVRLRVFSFRIRCYV